VLDMKEGSLDQPTRIAPGRTGSVPPVEPLISALAVGRTRTVAEPRWSPAGEQVAWIESFAGRADLVVAAADGLRPPAVVTPDIAVMGVGADGGGAWCFGSETEIVYAAADGRLVVVPVAGGEPRILSSEGHASAPVARDGMVHFALDRDDACHIARVPLDGSSWPERMSAGGDFAWDPTVASGGLAWLEWDLPAMPFSDSRIMLVDAEHDARAVAGGNGISVGQPRFSPDGSRLAYVCDASGWWNVWIAAADGSDATPLLEDAHDHAAPTWSPGQRSFAWSPDGSEIAFTRNDEGFARLIVASATPGSGFGTTREIAKAWHHSLDWGPRGIVAVRSGVCRATRKPRRAGPHTPRRAVCSTGRCTRRWVRAPSHRSSCSCTAARRIRRRSDGSRG
jgi:WD40-like Beta Propeller Repeat